MWRLLVPYNIDEQTYAECYSDTSVTNAHIFQPMLYDIVKMK